MTYTYEILEDKRLFKQNLLCILSDSLKCKYVIYHSSTTAYASIQKECFDVFTSEILYAEVIDIRRGI